jgi:outer membrane protein
LSGGQTQVTNDSSSYGTALSQLLPWGGGRITVAFDANRSATSNVFSTWNPSFGSGLSAAFTQPLLKGLTFDATRAGILRAEIDRTVAQVEVRRETATILNEIRRAYWALVHAADAKQTALDSENLARRHLDETRRRVELGTLAAIDLLEAEAEIALRHQTTVDAEGALRMAQVGLKRLIVRNTSDPVWNAELRPVDRPEPAAGPIDIAGAVAAAMETRTDVDMARQQIRGADLNLRLLSDDRKPGVDLVASYAVNGIGGTQVLRQSDALGGAIVGAVPGSYLDALGSIANLDYPTWSVGLNVTLPLGRRAADAAYARGQVEKRQADLALEALRLQVAADVTRVAEAVRSASESIQAAGVARELAQKRVDAEQARRDAGLATTFIVLQAQRDLAAAATNELRARLDYQTAVADFERAQAAP